MHRLDRPASLRIRTLFAILIMLVVLVGSLLLLTDSIIGRSFRAVEERTVQEHVQQAANALGDSIASLERTTNDYAVWDDTYAFVAKPDPKYVTDNTTDATFINNNLSYVAFVNTTGTLVYARAFDLATAQEVPPPAELNRFDGPNARLLQHTDSAKPLAGLIILADGPMLLAARPILTSLGAGPARGTLLMGRRLDVHEIARLSQIARLPLTVIRDDAPALTPDVQQAATALAAGQSLVSIPLDSQRISGGTHVADLRGGPGVLLQLDLPRDVVLLGQQATREYTLLLLITDILFGAIVFWMFERTVLARIITLSAQVALVEVSRPDTQVYITGHDEISHLGGAINRMLHGLAHAHQHLAESERRYRQILELSPDAVIVHDGQHIRYSNAVGTRLIDNGLSADVISQPVPTTIRALVPRDDGSPVLVERTLTQPDGTTIEAELVVLPFRDRDTAAIQVIVRNITERKHTEQALRAAKEAADAASRAKSQFLATMSHELRTPITAIIGHVDLLNHTLSPSTNSEVRPHLGGIRAASTHLLAIINAVLDLSKIEAGHMSVQCAPVLVSSLLAIVADTIQPLATHNGNRFELRGSTTLGAMETDEVHLRQILINLLSNACKFTHEGLVTLTVTAGAEHDEANAEDVVFAVSDTGIGIRPDHLGLLFRDFGQIDASTTRKYGGTGIGLALSQRLAGMLGGRITVTSALGVGSTFTLTLPRTHSGGDPSALSHRAVAPTEAPATPGVVPTPDALKTQFVLVIDDDSHVCDMFSQALAHPGLYFETAANGAEGLELAMALLPDLIILNVLLPELESWTVLRHLQEHPETCAIPVLLLGTDQHAERGLVLGTAGSLHNPLDHDQLTHAITSVLPRGAGPTHLLLVADAPALCDDLRCTLERRGWTIDTATDEPTAMALLDQRHPALAVIDMLRPTMVALIAAIRAHLEGGTLPILVVTAHEVTREAHTQMCHELAQILPQNGMHSEALLRSTAALLEAYGLPVLP